MSKRKLFLLTLGIIPTLSMSSVVLSCQNRNVMEPSPKPDSEQPHNNTHMHNPNENNVEERINDSKPLTPPHKKKKEEKNPQIIPDPTIKNKGNNTNVIPQIKLGPSIKKNKENNIIPQIPLGPSINNKADEPKKIPQLELIPAPKSEVPNLPKIPSPNDKTQQLLNTPLGDFLKSEGVVETLFLKGVNPNFSKFFHHINASDDIDSWWYAHNDNEEGWFDINKDFDRGDNLLCAAVVAANAIHYWSTQNKDYINKYLSDPQKGIIGKNNEIDFREINKFLEANNDNIKTKTEHSQLFEIFKKLYVGRTVWPDKIFDTYINGYGYSNRQQRNQEINYEKGKSGFLGFFKDVFGKHLLTDRWHFGYGAYAKPLSDRLRREIEANKAIGISHTYGSVSINHIINVWGADFDKDGIIKALYVTDSDDPRFAFEQEGVRKRLGIKRYRVDFNAADGKVYIGARKENITQALDIYSFGLGVNYWEDYFNNQSKNKS
ncbi:MULTISPECIES: IdeS/Mac family cysteine endopeptidase [unclassified Mycoplasma]|uniref:IdeS/Mac family cysteine endopeptidase n=1 Tax=Mycoplasma sp. 125 TaxID=3447505 RepID=UPI003F65DB71